jgi:hypothetical protein
MIIYSIRRLDNPFIPLFFHWSGRYIKRQLAGTLNIHDCYTMGLCNVTGIGIWTGNYAISYPREISEIVHMSPKSKFMNLNAHLQ